MKDITLNGFRPFIEFYLKEEDANSSTKHTVYDKFMYLGCMLFNIAANFCNSDYTKEIMGYISRWCDEELYVFDHAYELENFKNYPGDNRNWYIDFDDDQYSFYHMSNHSDPNYNNNDDYSTLTLHIDKGLTIYFKYKDIDTDIEMYFDDVFSLKEATCGMIHNIITLLKAVELAGIKAQIKKSQDKNFKWDPYSTDLSDPFFDYLREYLFTKEGNDKLYSRDYNIKNSKHLDLLDELKKQMIFYPFEYSERYIDGQSADGLFNTLESIEIITNIWDDPVNHGALILSDNVKESIEKIINDNTYKFVVSTVSVGNEEMHSPVDKVFPYMFLLSDYKALSINDVDETSSIKEDATFVYNWMVENLKAMDIDTEDISVGEINIKNLNTAIIKRLNNVTFDKSFEKEEEEELDELIPSTDPREAIFKPIDNTQIEESKCEVVELDKDCWKVEDIEEPKEVDQSKRLSLMLAMSKKIRESYMGLLFNQLMLDNEDLKDFAELLKIMLKEDFSGFYSKKKVSNDIDVREMFSNESILLNIVVNGKIIDVIFFGLGDKGWDSTRIYDKIATSNYQFKNMYYKNCGIDPKMKLGFTLTSAAGRMTYGMNEELAFMGKGELDNIDISMMSYDITMYILSGLMNAFMTEYILRQRDSDAHMVANYNSFKVRMRNFSTSEFLDGVEKVIDDKFLDKKDISDLQQLCEMECDDKFNKYDNSALNNQDTSVVITFFDGKIGRAGSDGLFISKEGKLGYKELYKKGSPLVISKNNTPIIIIENPDKSRYETHDTIRKVFKYFATR